MLLIFGRGASLVDQISDLPENRKAPTSEVGDPGATLPARQLRMHEVTAVSNTAVTARLTEFCRSIRFEDLPADAVEVARQCLLDWLGVTLAHPRHGG